MLRQVAERGERGMPASELVPKREYRDFVIEYLSKEGLIQVRRQGAGGRVYITEKGLRLLRDQDMS